MKKIYHAIGLMSGSSLDGLDIAHCRFEMEQNSVATWQLLRAETADFSEAWKERLAKLPGETAFEFARTHVHFGGYLGELVNQFLAAGHEKLPVDFIASHGHTIFHAPDQHFTSQIGDGAALAAITCYPVICDFRSSDVALGGQGAPLAPLADKVLFPGFDFYLNLGGIANITCNAGGKHVAFDVGGANQILNALARQLGKPFDWDGELAASGNFQALLFEKLNRFDYFAEAYPKSLSNQWVQENLVKTCLETAGKVEDKLHTFCHHLAFQLQHSISQVIERENFRKGNYRMFVTGGGGLNGFLMQCIREHCSGVEVVLPEGEIIKFKEALLMALLGALRMEGAANCISTVTGAKRDAIGGAVYLP
ncbi:MAG: anhydro-N-acetylmuramic acid kinase [Bacteroidota bacterium]